MSVDESLAVCPVCGSLAHLEAGVFVRHDNAPCVSVCRASTLTPDVAAKMRAQDDEIRREYYSGPPGSYTGD